MFSPIRKFNRFVYLTYRLSKIFTSYKTSCDPKNPESLKEFAVNTRKTFEELGPTFIKLGQHLSLRLDLLPAEVCKEFRKLLDHDPQISFEQAKQIVETELKSKLDEKFSHFDKKPIAAASLAQVHKAILKNGKTVAVKIQKPYVRESITEDIGILLNVAKVLSMHPSLKRLNPVGLIDGFSEWTIKELDFRIEARNMEKFKKNFSSFKLVKVPEVYWDYTTENVLVYEYLEGLTLNEVITAIENNDKEILSKLKKMKINLKTFMKNMTKILFKQNLQDGFFHADPHPANVILMPNDVIGFIDFGIMGELSGLQLSHLFILVLAFVEKDLDALVDLALKVGKADETTDIPLLRKKVDDLITGIRGATIEEIKGVDLFYKFFNILNECNLKLPVEYAMTAKTLAALDGVTDIIAPDYNLLQELKPYCLEMVKGELSEKFSERRLLKAFSSFLEFMGDLPTDLGKIIDNIKDGKIDIVVHEEPKKSEISYLRLLILFLAPLPISLLIAVRGNLGHIITGISMNDLQLTLLITPFVLIVLYMLGRKTLYSS